MIKINDIRSDNTKQLKDIEYGGYFYYDDVLYRRLSFAPEIIRIPSEFSDELVIVEVATGDIKLLNRLTWVEPISDKQVFLEISD